METKQNLGVRWDFFVSHFIASVGFILWGIQTISPKVNIGEILDTSKGDIEILTLTYWLLITLIVLLIVCCGILSLKTPNRDTKLFSTLAAVLLTASLIRLLGTTIEF